MFSYQYTNICNNDFSLIESQPEASRIEKCYLQPEYLINNNVTAQSYYNSYQEGWCFSEVENNSQINSSHQQYKPLLLPIIEHRNIAKTNDKKHHAKIVVRSTATGNYKTIIKHTKCKRTSFTTEQVAVLKQYFRKWPYITREQRQVLAEELQLNEKSVKIWFQNRRIKEKRESEENLKETVNPDPVNDNSKLDHVQSEIIKMTDENGFVTLDDRVMEGLVDVISNFLCDDNQVPVDGIEECNNSPLMYEPISPASVSDDNSEKDAFSGWSPSEPQESFQRLFDIQNMLSLRQL